MSEDRRVTVSSGRMSAEDVARHTFGTARRGFDPAEVRDFLEAVSREMLAAAEREQALREALTEAEHRATHPVLDEETLSSALGAETARVLRSAHEAASELVAKAEAESAARRDDAYRQADEVRLAAQQGADQLRAETERLVEERRREAEEEIAAAVAQARQEAGAALEEARAQGRAMVREAQELRARVLQDLSRRRRLLHAQIEQLRAGRSRLADTISGIRGEVDRIADELSGAEDEARLAAEEAARQAMAVEETAAETTAEVAAGVGDETAQGAPPAASGGAEAADATAGDRTADPEAVVEAIFARLRAAQPTSEPEATPGAEAGEPRRRSGRRARSRPASGTVVAEGPDALGGPAVRVIGAARAGEGADEDVEPAGKTGHEATAHGAAGRGEAAGDEAAGRGEAAGHGEATGDEAAGRGEAVVAAPATDERLQRRDQLLAPAVAGLARRLKRALQDDQNDVLHRLRAEGRWSAEVLPPEEDHLGRYREASAATLAEAARSGLAFLGRPEGPPPDVGALSSALAEAVVGPLRRRLDESGASGGDADTVADLVGSAYREWKGDPVQRLAGDYAVAAFSQAVVAAAGAGLALDWVYDDDGKPCPDCDDNALAGGVAAGDAFPTGHRHPPAHSGCRCLVAPHSPPVS